MSTTGGWQPKKRAKDEPPARSPRRRRARVVDAGVDEQNEPIIAPEPTAPRRVPPPGERHGDRTGQIRVKLGKRWSTIVTEIKRGEYSWQEFVEGLDPEELARGRLKDASGGWRGTPSPLVPREFHLACQRELKRRFEELFSGSVLEMAQMYIKLAQHPETPIQTKAKMLQYGIERIMGGIPKEFKVSQEAQWEGVLSYITSGEDAVPDWQARRNAGYAERMGDGEPEEGDE